MSDNTERDELADVKSRAEKFIAAHDEMCRIGQGVGGLAVLRPDLMPDFDAWYHASDVEHADTVLAVIAATRPRTITTVEELDALPIYSVVLSEGVAYQHYGQWEAGSDEIQWSAEGRWWFTSQVDLPATVLHEPAEASL